MGYDSRSSFVEPNFRAPPIELSREVNSNVRRRSFQFSPTVFQLEVNDLRLVISAYVHHRRR